MIRFILRRLLIVPLALLLVHFLGFTYALVAQRIQASRNPFVAPTFSAEPTPLLATYFSYFQEMLHGQFGTLPAGRGGIVSVVLEASLASLGLLAIAFTISLVLGLALGLYAVRTRPPGSASWLIPISTVGLAMPGFYVGILLVAAMIFYTLRTFNRPPLPFDGFGWDRHLILPVFALSLRPTLQLAQTTSRLLGEELKRRYVTAERSLGYSWQRIRWRTALRNVLVPIIFTTAGSFRLMLGELVLIELLFNWPGIGRLFALTLIPPLTSAGNAGVFFLNPPVLALLLTILAFLFLLADLIASLLARWVDPRLDRVGGEVAHA
ncbi:MAG: ABC transporter permease [Chloroflexota bacterium]|nr:ABC transporter permease [Chloroflexota bacterium]